MVWVWSVTLDFGSMWVGGGGWRGEEACVTLAPQQPPPPPPPCVCSHLAVLTFSCLPIRSKGGGLDCCTSQVLFPNPTSVSFLPQVASVFQLPSIRRLL